MKIPKTLESAIDAAVSRHLEAELADRSLLLTSADLAIAEAKTAVLGRRLMTSVLKQCYPEADGLTVEFERTGDIGRIGAALAFGAVTSRVFAWSVGDRSRRQAAIELLCGTFNLAIGLVDGICDADVATGEQLLDHFHDADLVGAASHRRGPGWLHAEMPLFLAADDGVAFTISVTEAFFENLHNIYADNADVRRIVGEQLADALKAETASVRRPLTALSAETEDRVLQSNFGTALRDHRDDHDRPSCHTVQRATMLGEAMWRIDDLVDIIDDARVRRAERRTARGVRRRGSTIATRSRTCSAVLASSASRRRPRRRLTA